MVRGSMVHEVGVKVLVGIQDIYGTPGLGIPLSK
jgi:hypothetical protein